MRAFAGVVFFLFITNIFPQTINLRDTTNQFDYIIITVPEFASACQPLKDNKEQNRNLKTIIVDTTAIFAEFNTDTTKQDDIRRFLSYAGTYWQEPKPQFVFIVGNTSKVPSYHLKDFLGVNGPLSQTDYYYSQNFYDPDTLKKDFLVGRLPASNINEVSKYSQKIFYYEDTLLNIDYDKVLLIAQYDSSNHYLNTLEGITHSIPTIYQKKLFSDNENLPSFGNKDSIANYINKGGVSSLWLSGALSDSAIFNPNYFNLSDISLLQNSSDYFITIAFHLQHFGTDTTTSFMDELLVREHGSIAGFAMVGIFYYGISKSYYSLLADSLYNSNTSLVRATDIYSIQHYTRLNVNYWGDPSLKLHPQNLTGVDDDITAFVPKEFSLKQNYPNPFNPSTRIQYEIPVTLRQAQRDNPHVQLIVFDVLGNEVAVLVDEFKPAGSYEVDFNAKGLSSGIYFYQLKAGNFVETKKMVLLR